MSLEYISDFLKLHSRRDACIRFFSFFSFFVYGVLVLAEECIIRHNIYIEYLSYILPIKSLIIYKSYFLIANQQLDLTRIITRVFDLPINLYTFKDYSNKAFSQNSINVSIPNTILALVYFKLFYLKG